MSGSLMFFPQKLSVQSGKGGSGLGGGPDPSARPREGWLLLRGGGGGGSAVVALGLAVPSFSSEPPGCTPVKAGEESVEPTPVSVEGHVYGGGESGEHGVASPATASRQTRISPGSSLKAKFRVKEPNKDALKSKGRSVPVTFITIGGSRDRRPIIPTPSPSKLSNFEKYLRDSTVDPLAG